MTEREEAIALANRVLDRIGVDPDDNLAVLARQFLRASEAVHDKQGEINRLRYNAAHPDDPIECDGTRVAPGCPPLLPDERNMVGEIRTSLNTYRLTFLPDKSKQLQVLLDIIDRLIGEQHCDNCGAPMHFDQEGCSQCG